MSNCYCCGVVLGRDKKKNDRCTPVWPGLRPPRRDDAKVRWEHGGVGGDHLVCLPVVVVKGTEKTMYWITGCKLLVMGEREKEREREDHIRACCGIQDNYWCLCLPALRHTKARNFIKFSSASRTRTLFNTLEAEALPNTSWPGV